MTSPADVSGDDVSSKLTSHHFVRTFELQTSLSQKCAYQKKDIDFASPTPTEPEALIFSTPLTRCPDVHRGGKEKVGKKKEAIEHTSGKKKGKKAIQ